MASEWIVWGLRLFSVGAFGGIFACVAEHRKHRRRAFAIQIAQPTKVANLRQIASAIADEIGPGAWQDYVQVWGRIRPIGEPDYSMLQRKPCVYCTYTVERKYRPLERRGKGSSVRQEISSSTKTEVVESRTVAQPFYLEDETGRILVNPDGVTPDGVTIEAVEILNEHRSELGYRDPNHDDVRQFGNLSHHLRPVANPGITLGFQYRESILAPGQSVLVVGEVRERLGNLQLGQPMEGDRRCYICLTPAQEAVIKAKQEQRTVLLQGLACALLSPFLWWLSTAL